MYSNTINSDTLDSALDSDTLYCDTLDSDTLDSDTLETKYECSPFLEIFLGDSIVRPSHPAAQVVRTLSTHGHRDWVQE